MGMQAMGTAPARNQVKAVGKASKIAGGISTNKTGKVAMKMPGKAPVAVGPKAAGFGGNKPHASTLASGNGRSQTGAPVGGGGTAGTAPVKAPATQVSGFSGNGFKAGKV